MISRKNTATELAARSLVAVSWNYVGSIARMLVQLSVQIFLARALGPVVYGQFAAALVVLNVGWLIADGGFGAALIQSAEISEEDVAHALGWILLTGLFVGGVIVLLSPTLAWLFKSPDLIGVFRLCGALVPLQAVSNLPLSLLRRELAEKKVQFIQVGSYLFGFGAVGIALAKSGCGVESLLAASAAQSICVLVSAYLCVRHPVRAQLSGRRQLRVFGVKVLGVNLANWSIESLDRFIVGAVWGVSQLGAYSAALNLARAPAGFIAGTIQAVTFASAAKLQDDTLRVRRGLLALMSCTLLITLPMFAVLALSADFVTALFYGAKWRSAAVLFQAFALSMPFYMIVAIAGPILSSMGYVGRELKIQLATAALITAALYLASACELKQAVWVIPLVYVVRATLMVLAIAPVMTLTFRDFVEATRGGFLLAGLASTTWWLIGLFSALPIVAQIVGATVACLGAMIASRGKLLDRNASQLLLVHKGNSPLAYVMAKASGLR